MLTLQDLSFLNGATLLITGGTGSLGDALTRVLLQHSDIAKIIIYSRDEFKQFQMKERLAALDSQNKLRFFLGDVRDLARLQRACEGVDYIIHAAALKQVPAAEYNPFEFVKTNINGAENVINAALDNNVKHVVALSTDKAATPINLYGATKLCSDKLFVSGNSYAGNKPTRFSVVRYGNVVGSRGSVIPFFLRKRKDGVLPITHAEMTRFWITLAQGTYLVLNALREMQGGEIWVPKIPSMRIADLANVIGPTCEKPVVGIRPGEKLHEVMVPIDDARQTLEFDTHYVITPTLSFWSDESMSAMGGKTLPDNFYYGSDNNSLWVTPSELAAMIAGLDLPEAKEWAAEQSTSGTQADL